MCGVAMIVALGANAAPPRREELARMNEALRHRGPDDAGIVVAGRAGVAHTRLAIIDPVGGKQPMQSAGVILSYNGEVFDFPELRAELEARGRRFTTRSDTEVVLRAYEEWGDACFSRFDGQFAVAIWDARRNVVVLARDRVGIHPLYVTRHAGRLYVASEIKAIFAADRTVPRALDPLALDETFTFWTVVPPRTAFTGISEIEPGHVCVVDAATAVANDREYWSPDFTPTFRGSLDDAVAAVRAALTQATERRLLRADVRVGAYLSGGLDSSLIAALAARAAKVPLATFSLRFADAEYDEGRFQSLVARRLGTEHREVVVRRSEIASAWPEVVRHAERPMLRAAPAPMGLLSRFVRSCGISVVLSGEGADEVFAGYDLFREAKVRRFWARHPASTCRPRLLERLYPYLARSPVTAAAMARQFFGRGLEDWARPGFGHDPRWRTTTALKRLFSRELRERIGAHDARRELLANARREHPLAQDQRIEMRTLLGGYLLSAQGDRMLMASSVEGRYPFLDRDVVALANALPPAYKLRVLDEKHVLKSVAADLLPASIVRRTKQPYRAPDALALAADDAPDAVRSALDDAAIARAGLFEPSAVRRLVAKCRASTDGAVLSNADNMALVGVVSTQLLHAELVETSRARPASMEASP